MLPPTILGIVGNLATWSRTAVNRNSLADCTPDELRIIEAELVAQKQNLLQAIHHTYESGLTPDEKTSTVFTLREKLETVDFYLEQIDQLFQLTIDN